MTNLWWPLLNFPRNQDIFFASSLHDDGQNLQTSPGAVLYILGGKISKLGIGYKHRILCLLFGDKNFIVLLRKFYVHAKESKRFYPWFFSTSSRKYLPILYIKPIIIILQRFAHADFNFSIVFYIMYVQCIISYYLHAYSKVYNIFCPEKKMTFAALRYELQCIFVYYVRRSFLVLYLGMYL